MQCGTSTQKVTMRLCDSDLKYKHLFNNNTENYELLNHLEALHHISSTRKARKKALHPVPCHIGSP